MSVNNNDSARIIYQRSNRKKYYLLIFCAIGLFIITGYAIATGSYGLSLASVIKSLSGEADQKEMAVIWNIRLPRITAAIFSGWGLGLAGCVMQFITEEPAGLSFYAGNKSWRCLWRCLCDCCSPGGHDPDKCNQNKMQLNWS